MIYILCLAPIINAPLENHRDPIIFLLIQCAYSVGRKKKYSNWCCRSINKIQLHHSFRVGTAGSIIWITNRPNQCKMHDVIRTSQHRMPLMHLTSVFNRLLNEGGYMWSPHTSWTHNNALELPRSLHTKLREFYFTQSWKIGKYSLNAWKNLYNLYIE